MAVNRDDFKRALGSWGSGVAIVTARAGEEIHGMTVSAFSSVSLDPPLVLVCANKSSNTHLLMERTRCFAANLLAVGQQQLAVRFADKAWETRRFEGLDYESAVTGAPLLTGVVAGIDCVTVDQVDAGDHVIHIGRVEYVSTSDRVPLLHVRGSFGDFRHRDVA